MSMKRSYGKPSARESYCEPLVPTRVQGASVHNAVQEPPGKRLEVISSKFSQLIQILTTPPHEPRAKLMRGKGDRAVIIVSARFRQENEREPALGNRNTRRST